MVYSYAAEIVGVNMTEQPKPHEITGINLEGEWYTVGRKGVKAISVDPPVYLVLYDDGTTNIFCIPNKTVQWKTKEVVEPLIAVPDTAIVGADGTNPTQ